MKATLELPESHSKALRILVEKVPPDKILWVLTGSGGLRLQGVDVAVHDLDIQSDEPGIYELARRMARFTKRAPQLMEGERIRSHFGSLLVEGVLVELMGDIQHRKQDGSWDEPPELLSLKRWVPWKGQLIPVLDLRYEARAYSLLGRDDKVKAIRSVLARPAGGTNA